MFDFSKIEDFDSHINQSIPNYSSLFAIFKSIAEHYAQPYSHVVDLGCSTGAFLHQLNKNKDTHYHGIDVVDFKNRKKGFQFHKGDVYDHLMSISSKIGHTSVLISMFTLQFLGRTKRQRILPLIQEVIDKGAILLIAEKVYLNDPILQMLVHRQHIQEKRKHFTDKEILDKDIELSNSMFCKNESLLEQELNGLGFKTKVWQSYNFMAYTVQGRL
tara:strand:+ start:2175 stop:2822 length:648 start_codon:yes stop_codon:yes gene_type:complete